MPRSHKFLSFKIIGANDTDTIARLYVISTSGTETVDVTGHADYTMPLDIDLSTNTGVTRLEIRDITDGYGMGSTTSYSKSRTDRRASEPPELSAQSSDSDGFFSNRLRTL